MQQVGLRRLQEEHGEAGRRARGRAAPGGGTERPAASARIGGANGNRIEDNAGRGGAARRNESKLAQKSRLQMESEQQRRAEAEAQARREMEIAAALAEVEALLARDLDPALPVMRAIGVPEIKAMLEGDLSRAEAIAAGQLATRQYAKRQYTWFRNQLPQSWPRADNKTIADHDFFVSLFQ